MEYLGSLDRQGPKLSAPAAERNGAPIIDVLARVLPREGMVLEVASGSGQHALRFARRFSALDWQPSDRSAEARASIAAWVAEAELANLRRPLALDVHDEAWPVDEVAALVCINLLHIAPWSACAALCRGAARIVPAGGLFYLYGPFNLSGRHTSDGNARFDADLRARDPRWGLRDVDDVAALAASSGLSLS